MPKNMSLIIGGLAIAAVAGVFLVRSRIEPMPSGAPATDVSQIETDGMIKDAGAAEGTPTESVVSGGTYEAYASEKLSRAATGDVILFFHASWCPSCRGLNASIEQGLSDIPAGVTILKTDYDKETELKKKYGVTYQHTMVQVDEAGNLIKKWSGSPSLAALLAQVE
jgi:thioredoxin 1